MNRDWIQTGRRPAGLCGAALMMAARLHGFNRTVDDIVDVVRIGDKTLLMRIREFTNTPSSELTPSQFLTMDTSVNTLPPCMRNHEELKEEDIDSKSPKKKKRRKSTKNEPEKKKRRAETYHENEESSNTKPKSLIASILADEDTNAIDAIEITNDMNKILSKPENWLDPTKTDSDLYDKPIEPIITEQPALLFDTKIEDKDIKNKDDEENLSDIDDEEIDCYILKPEEREIKEKLWYMMNKDYLAEAEEKKRLKELEASKPKRKRGKKKTTTTTDTTAAEEDQASKPSSRINMDAYNNLLNKLKGFVDEEEEFLEEDYEEIEI
jgi:transcription factor IIIB subunit 2